MPGHNNPQRETRILQGLVGITLIAILIFIIGDVFNLFDKIVNLIRNRDCLPITGCISGLIILTGMLGFFSWRRVHELQREGRKNEEAKQSAIRQFKFEEELQKSEEKYRTLVENVNFGVYRNTSGPHGRFLQVNPALAKMHGYNSVEELMQVNISDLYQNPEERKLLIEEMTRKGFVKDKELRLRKKDGTPFWGSVTAKAHYDASGTVDWFDGAIEDITERKQIEEEIQQAQKFITAIVENIPDMIFVKDAQALRFVRFNKAGEKLLGYSGEEMIGKNDYDFFPREEADFFTAKDREVLEGRKLVDIPEEPIETKHQGLRILHTKKIPIYDEVGKPQYLLGISEDITGRKQAEIKLQESKSSLRALLNATTEVAFLMDTQGTIVAMNEPGAKRVGKKVDELYGVCLYDLLPDDVLKVRKMYFEEVVHSSKPVHFEDERLGRMFETSIYPIFNEQGKVVKLAIYGQDITERKQAEEELKKYRDHLQELVNERTKQLSIANEQLKQEIEERKKVEQALRESELRYRSLLEAAFEGIAIHQAGRIIEANQMLATMFGYKLPEIIGKSVVELAASESRELLNKNITSGFYQPYEGLGLKKDGSTFPVELVGKNIQYKGQNVRVAVLRDISERKRAEARILQDEIQYHITLDSMRDAIHVVDTDLRIILFNQAFKKWCQEFGLETIAIGRNVFDVFPFLPEKVRKEYQQVFDTGKVLMTEDITNLVGREIITEARKIPILEEGKVTKIVTAIRDITEQKQAELKIKTLNVKLEQRLVELKEANQELEAFNYSVSHDLRAPLQVIGGSAQVLMHQYGKEFSEESRQCLHLIQKNTKKMNAIIESLLAFSRLGGQALNIAEINMNELVKAIYIDLTSITLNHNLQVTIHSLLPSYGDSAMVRRVLVNLLLNAVKFTQHQRNPVIEIGCWDDHDCHVYYVKDNGIGFDQQDSEKLFGVFQRLGNVKEFEGHGIGLALVQRIIQRHHGRVWAEGKLNQGATFYFALPKKELNSQVS